MPIPANYFSADPELNGDTPADRDIARVKHLSGLFARMVQDIQTGTTRSGEPLTAAQKTNIRNKYAQWRTDVQAWFNGLPTP